MHFECRHCGARLSSELRTIHISERNKRMGVDLLPTGTVMQEDGSYFQARAGVFVGNAEDLFEVKLTDDSRRLAGCCGLDGCDGPNLQCERCGTYVATKRTDCWMAHCAVLEPDTTKAVPGL